MTPPDETPVCYFDVTDIVHYATGHPRVSGIQRVQLNLIGHLVRRMGGRLVRCTFEDPRRKAMFEFDPTSLFDDDEFDSELLLRRVGLTGNSRIFPSKTSMRRYLRPYGKNKLQRTALKVDILLSALVFPRRLAAHGLRRPTAKELAIEPVHLRRVDRLPPDACAVYLGSSWVHPRVIAFGRDHAARGGNVVQMVYDLIPRVQPEFVSRNATDGFNRWLDEILVFTCHFVCISHWTQAALRSLVGQRDDVRIETVALAHEFRGFERFDPVALGGGAAVQAAEGPYVLCVGTIEPRKNGIALLEAWRRLGPKLGERLPRLVFAGRQGWLMGEFLSMLAADPELARRVRIVESPSDRELAFLYQRCLFTAFPSRSEGWGLPVGEAAWFGKFTICSNATSLPEVCGALVDYFEPTDLDALCALLERALTDADYVRAKERAIVQSPMRCWADVADDIWMFIEQTRHRAQPTARARATHHAAD